MKRYIFIIGYLLVAVPSWAVTKYVSPSGSALWVNCTSAETPCSLATANSNADDDDIVIMADGDYGTSINPGKAGSSGHPITYQAANKYGPIIKNPTNWTTNRQAGVILYYSYIVIDGIKVDASTFTATGENHYLYITSWNPTHIEIKNCWFTGIAKGTTLGGTHIWIHDNLFENSGFAGDAPECNTYGGGMQIGSTGSYSGIAGYNTIENNTFRYGGHHGLETFNWYNVVRNNFFHNEGNFAKDGCTNQPDSNGLYGDRNLQLYDGTNADGTFNILEGNRFGPSGAPSDDDGGDGLTITAPKNIIRHNSIYSAQNNGVLFKIGGLSYPDYNHFYNNTVTGSGRYDNGAIQGFNLRWYRSTARCGQNNIIKNNIFYVNNGSETVDMNTDASCNPATYTTNTVENNFCTYAQAGKCSANGDPLFTDGSLPAITSTPNTIDPNLALQSGSSAINGGTYLTLASGAGDNNATLHVDDALYFQDGTWGSSLSNIQADWIAIGTVTNTVQISSIDYATNTITLAEAKSWDDDAPIWLYKKSDGTRVLYGSAPDYGAFEWIPTTFSGPGGYK